MRVALYARVSTEASRPRGTIGSQLAVLRDRVGAEGDELVGEFVDDGHSGARLDRPGLDALRDAAEAGLIERVWCLSPDRLARVYAYQVLVLDELARFGVEVRFTDAPPLRRRPAGHPAHPGAGRDRRVREGQDRRTVPARQAVPRPRRRGGHLEDPLRLPPHPPQTRTGPAHLEVYEPEAAVVRRIFTDRAAGTRARDHAAGSTPTGAVPDRQAATWGTSTLCRLLRNEAYIGRVYFNRTESVPDRRPGGAAGRSPATARTGSRSRCPRIVTDELFEAAGRVAATTASGARAGPNPASGCCGAWSNAVSAGRHQLPQDARPQRHLAPLLLLPQPRPDARRRRRPPLPRTQHPRRRPRHVRVRPGPRRAAAPRPAAPPANKPSPLHPRPPTTNCSPPNWPAWTASSTPPTPNAAAWSTSTRPGSSSCPSCSAAPPRSPHRRHDLSTTPRRPRRPTPGAHPRQPAPPPRPRLRRPGPRRDRHPRLRPRNRPCSASSSKTSASPAGTSHPPPPPPPPPPPAPPPPASVKPRRFAFRWW